MGNSFYCRTGQTSVIYLNADFFLILFFMFTLVKVFLRFYIRRCYFCLNKMNGGHFFLYIYNILMFQINI